MRGWCALVHINVLELIHRCIRLLASGGDAVFRSLATGCKLHLALRRLDLRHLSGSADTGALAVYSACDLTSVAAAVCRLRLLRCAFQFMHTLGSVVELLYLLALSWSFGAFTLPLCMVSALVHVLWFSRS